MHSCPLHSFSRERLTGEPSARHRAQPRLASLHGTARKTQEQAAQLAIHAVRCPTAQTPPLPAPHIPPCWRTSQKRGHIQGPLRRWLEAREPGRPLRNVWSREVEACKQQTNSLLCPGCCLQARPSTWPRALLRLRALGGGKAPSAFQAKSCLCCNAAAWAIYCMLSPSFCKTWGQISEDKLKLTMPKGAFLSCLFNTEHLSCAWH